MTRPDPRLFAAGLRIVAAAAGLLPALIGGPARAGQYIDQFPAAMTNSSGDIGGSGTSSTTYRRADGSLTMPRSSKKTTFSVIGPPSGVSATDTATIQNAINAGYGGNAPIRLGAGTWQVCGGLTISLPLLVIEASNANDYQEPAVLGHSRSKTIITCTAGPTAPYITISGAYGITIRGIAFYGNASHPCVALLNSHSVTLDGDGFFSCVNGVDDSSNSGSTSSQDLTVKNSVFSEASNCGYYMHFSGDSFGSDGIIGQNSGFAINGTSPTSGSQICMSARNRTLRALLPASPTIRPCRDTSLGIVGLPITAARLLPR